MKEIIVDTLPTPNGHYSHAVVFNGAVYVSGVLPMACRPQDPLKEQFDAVFSTLEKILSEAGSSLKEAVSVRIYISDLNDWPEINRMYGEWFGARRPARVVVPVKELHFGYRLEVEVMAAVIVLCRKTPSFTAEI